MPKLMKSIINKLGGVGLLAVALLALVATLSQSSASLSAATPNLRFAKITHEEMSRPKNGRRLGPLGRGGGSSGSGGGSSSGGSSGGGSSGSSNSGGDSSGSTSSNSDGSNNSGSSSGSDSDSDTTTSRTDTSNVSAANESFFASWSPSVKRKELHQAGRDRNAASVVVASVGGLLCLLLLLSMVAIGSYKVFTHKGEQDGDGILSDDNNKAEHLVTASLDYQSATASLA